ncbi:hypothetical protein C365_01868 [Cryptococcus neoformans Bt85]|nr:hypothetical protein C365_01868 [Cryptococcus neoformans var. grubii Bt85]OXM80656.1 hypothetical protein C364_01673 [Cryptococcus neoformans var. grubii Bt63]
MKKIASTHSTQGDAAQDDLKDKKDESGPSAKGKVLLWEPL